MNLDNEKRWEVIKNYQNYLISDHGDVFSVKRNKLLKQHLTKCGYLYVALHENNTHKNYNIHRLVASAFCLNNENNKVVDHINKNKLDNHFSNLRWTTYSLNSRNATLSKSNKSGHKGIQYRSSHDAWIAHYYNDNKKQISKSFSINKYPDAKELAIAYNQKMRSEHGYI